MRDTERYVCVLERNIICSCVSGFCCFRVLMWALQNELVTKRWIKRKEEKSRGTACNNRKKKNNQRNDKMRREKRKKQANKSENSERILLDIRLYFLINIAVGMWTCGYIATYKSTSLSQSAGQCKKCVQTTKRLTYVCVHISITARWIFATWKNCNQINGLTKQRKKTHTPPQQHQKRRWRSK